MMIEADKHAGLSFLLIAVSLVAKSCTVSSFAFQCRSHESSSSVSNSFRRNQRYPRHLVLSAASDDDFDPLLSPHAYNKGTHNKPSAQGDVTDTNSNSNKDDNLDDNWTPFQMKTVKDDFQGASDEDYKVEKSTFTRKWSTTINTVESSKPSSDEEEVELFDPLLSPHAYVKGATSKPVPRNGGKDEAYAAIMDMANLKQPTKRNIGVLLIDHGSRRQTSNDRLMQIATLYQSRAPSHYTIKAVHMEIADPSIQDGIREFVSKGITKIVCHPYFLSPGRHVLEDIPELISEAVEVVSKEEFDFGVLGEGELEVLTTDPVGSNLDLMVDLIGTMVDETAGIDGGEEESYESGFVKEKNKDYGAMGGFFGEVQRMMDEQLD